MDSKNRCEVDWECVCGETATTVQHWDETDTPPCVECGQPMSCVQRTVDVGPPVKP